MDTSAQIACCLICTLAERMKDCDRCPFRAGLAVKATATKESTEFLKTELSEKG